MSKKIIIGSILTILVTGALSYGAYNYINQHKEQKIDLNQIESAYNEKLNEVVSSEKEKLEAQYNSEKVNNIDTMLTKLAQSLAKYYTDSNVSITKTLDDLSYEIKLSHNSNKPIKDNDFNIENIYTLDDTISIVNEGKTIRSDIKLSVTYNSTNKFDVNNNKLIINYLEEMMGKELSDDDKTTINILVNMKLEDIKSIKEMKNYLYNDSQVKINDSIFTASTEEALDEQGQPKKDVVVTSFEICTDKDNPYYVEPEKDK